MSPFFLSPFSDVVSNCCLLAGHILASEFSVVLSKCGVRNRRERRSEGEVKCPDELHSDVVLVIYHFFTASYKPMLIPWSVQEPGEVQALKLVNYLPSSC